MPISTEDIKIRAPQRLTDETDGGGYMTAKEVVDGSINNLFTDISRWDRTYGRVSLREAFLHVATSDTDMYSGAHVIIAKRAADPNVNVALFSVKGSEGGCSRSEALNRLESYVTLGPRFQGWLWGDQPAGARMLLIYQPTGADAPKVGDVLCLFNSKGTANEYSQYVLVTKVTAKTQSFTVGQRTFSRIVLTLEIGNPLEVTFIGIEMAESDATATSIYTTVASESSTYYGVMAPTEAIADGDTVIQVDSIYTQLVPTSQAETAMTGLTPGEAGPIKKSGDTYTLTFGYQSWTVLNLAQAFVPGTLSLTIGSTVFTDPGTGVLYQGSNQAGSISYALGQVTMSPARTGAVTATFDPGCAMALTPATLMVPVFAASRGYNYVGILWPPVTPGTLTVDYMAEGVWYRLRDNGAGLLVPDIENTGTGRVDYGASQFNVTCAALPDVDTPIIARWGSPVELVQMQGVVEIDVDPVSHTLANAPVAPGSLVIEWPTGLSTIARAVDNGAGYITGDATGWLNYGSGEMEFIPKLLPVAGSNYTINHDRYAQKTFSGSGLLSFTLPSAPIKPGSVALDVTVSVGGWTHTYKMFDWGDGKLTADGFAATLSQCRESLADSSVIATDGTSWSSYYSYTDSSSTGSDIVEGSSEKTVTLSVGSISAQVDYVTGATMVDLSTAIGVKTTISASSKSSSKASESIDIDARIKLKFGPVYTGNVPHWRM